MQELEARATDLLEFDNEMVSINCAISHYSSNDNNNNNSNNNCLINNKDEKVRQSVITRIDISKNLNNDNSINRVQQWRNSNSTVYNQADRLSSNDLENQYISWLKSIENATNNNLKTSFSIENDGGNADNYAQNNYMYIESSLNETPPSTNNQQSRQRCSLEQTFNNNVTKPIVHNSSPVSDSSN
ncbi:unnamed protein product [Trichobilharzia regenti]|nr:unnamed protein product [Trichobilharzia regenti]